MKPVKPAIVVAVGLAFGAICAAVLIALPTTPPEGSIQARNTDGIYRILLGVDGVIFGLVTVVLLYAVFAFRARRGDLSDGEPIHGVTWLEIVWTAIPAAIVVILAVLSYGVLSKNEKALAKSRSAEALHVHVEGQQFLWSYEYDDTAYQVTPKSTGKVGPLGTAELVVPVGKPIVFALETKDVIHSFWVPAWRVQMNTTPGQVNHLTVTPTKTGTFEVVCAFLCGANHAEMNSSVKGATVKPVRVVSQADFDTWIRAQMATAAQG